MKKFLAICLMLFIVFIVGLNLSINNFKYKYDSKYLTRVEGKKILMNINEQWTEFDIKGVNINSVQPGLFPGEYKTSEADFLRWFEYIKQMNANSIRVSYIMPNVFYSALKKFNESSDKPLYLLQGIQIDEVLLKDGEDLQGKKIKKYIEKYIKNTINAIHGNPYKSIPADISEIYEDDVSKYVIGYTLGIELSSYDIIYSEIMNDEKTFKGYYFKSLEGASKTEVYLAELADYLVSYEYENYGDKKPITIIGSAYNFIESIDTNLQMKLEEDYYNIPNNIDVRNIEATNNSAGLFASFNIYPSVGYLRENSQDIDSILEKIENAHDIPLLISEYGIPSSRLVADFASDLNVAGISENEQGQKLAQLYNSIKQSNAVGSFLFNWQDDYSMSSWNTKEKIILDKSPYWSNAQNYAQNYGLLSFEVGDFKTYPDEFKDEWNTKNIILKSDDADVYVKNDEKYIHFMVDLKDKNIDYNQVILDLDVTPKSGSDKYSEKGLKFNSPVDFIVNIDSKEKSEVLVHEYYSTAKFMQTIKDIRLRPDRAFSEKSIDNFVPVKEIISPKVYIQSENKFMEEIYFDTGTLVHANANPSSDEYNSLSDFYIGDGYIEIRIPWAILNFMDPSGKKIHDDYFSEFQIKPLSISNIYVGLTIKKENEEDIRIPSETYNLNGWIKPAYNERLKESYYILKDVFKD